MSTDLTQPDLERPGTRTDLAHQLLGRVERLAPCLGTIPWPLKFTKLLKRDYVMRP